MLSRRERLGGAARGAPGAEIPAGCAGGGTPARPPRPHLSSAPFRKRSGSFFTLPVFVFGYLSAVSRIRLFFGLLDPDPLVRGTRSGSFYHQAMKNDVNVPSKSTVSVPNKQKNFFFKLVFVGVLKVNDENSRIQIRIRILVK
jgi:hypothetical protein